MSFICHLKDQGGLGVDDLDVKNMALMSKATYLTKMGYVIPF
jgi:hypothetical protein